MPADRAPAKMDSANRGLLQRFLGSSVASGFVLLGALAVAMAWANSRWADAYEELWSTQLALHVGGLSIGTDLRSWIGDGLMTAFFLLVGVEIERELRSGQLREPRVVSLPVIAAVGGMIAPALIYVAVVGGGDAARGWGVPMATDIALALGALTLAARFAPADIRPLLLTLAIVDDIGAIVVVTVFYASGGTPVAFLAAVAFVGAIVLAERIRLHVWVVYVVLGVGLWYSLLRAGVEPAISGVVLGLLAPPAAIGRFERVLLPWSGFVVVPLFALANAGVRLDASTLAGAGGAVAGAIVIARLFGKPLGVVAGAKLGVATGVSRLPPQMGWASIVGLGVTTGIGFTVSLFIADLAFVDDPTLLNAAKVGIMVSALLAGFASYITFLFGARDRS